MEKSTPPDWAMRTKADTLAIERGCYWDEQAGSAIVAFANSVFHPQYISGDFRLLQWQERFLRSVYSWRNLDGTRRFRTANLHIAKKNGKTLLVSIICAFELFASNEVSPFVVSGSTSKENASQVFAEIVHTIDKAKLKKFAKVTANQRRLSIPSLNSHYRSLASDGDTAQGFNCSLVVLDECHAHKSSSLYDSLRYATASRPNGLLVCISTAGDDVTCFYYGIYQKSKRVLSGDDTDITHYAEVYESEGDTDDKHEWAKANPSLGVSFGQAQFENELNAAKNDRAEFSRFCRYKLNRWVRADEQAYYDVAIWDKNKRDEPDNLKRFDCWLGVDLSQTTDPSSVSAVWHLGNQRYYCKSFAWVAREGVKQREKMSLPKYQEFANVNAMTITEGDRIDDLLILNHILALCRANRVKSVTFDPTSAMIMMGLIEAEGYNVNRMSQTHHYYSAPMKEFNKQIIEGKILHDGNDWLRYCLQSVRIDENNKGEIRPHTKRSQDHIDGHNALLMAYSQAILNAGQQPTSVYDTRGITRFRW